MVKYTTDKGDSLSLENSAFAKGGEGEVFTIQSPNKFSGNCVKLYFTKKRTSSREKKLAYMVANNPDQSRINNGRFIICWPVAVVYENGKFAGFMMPKAFPYSELLYELCTIKLPRKLSRDWQLKYDRANGKESMISRLKLCTNIASAIYQIHRMSIYTLVDLKPQNLLITKDAKISLIDCDSVQIAKSKMLLHSAKVMTPEYMPREAKRINILKSVVSTSWDNFSLAVIFYEIIFGVHPYAAAFKGRFSSNTTIASNIAAGLFVHGKNKSYISALPPPHKNFNLLPDRIRSLFMAAFDSGNMMPDVRPKAEDWGGILFNEIKKNKPGIANNKFQKTYQRQNVAVSSNKKNLPRKGVGKLGIAYTVIPPLGFIMSLYYSNRNRTLSEQQAKYCAIGGLLAWFLIIIVSNS